MNDFLNTLLVASAVEDANNRQTKAISEIAKSNSEQIKKEEIQLNISHFNKFSAIYYSNQSDELENLLFTKCISFIESGIYDSIRDSLYIPETIKNRVNQYILNQEELKREKEELKRKKELLHNVEKKVQEIKEYVDSINQIKNKKTNYTAYTAYSTYMETNYTAYSTCIDKLNGYITWLDNNLNSVQDGETLLQTCKELCKFINDKRNTKECLEEYVRDKNSSYCSWGVLCLILVAVFLVPTILSGVAVLYFIESVLVLSGLSLVISYERKCKYELKELLSNNNSNDVVE